MIDVRDRTCELGAKRITRDTSIGIRKVRVLLSSKRKNYLRREEKRGFTGKI